MSLSEFLKKDLYSSLSNNIPLKNFLVLKYYKTSKTIIGICLYNNKKRFFKIINDPEDEIRRINCIKSIYRIPKVIDVINNKCIIYEYIKDFKFKTINDYLYNNNKEMSSEKFLNQYNISINDTLCLLNETNSQSKKYFQNRVNLLNNYLKKLPYQYLIINEKKYNIKLTIKNIKQIILKNKKIYMITSQGDPTDTNITMTGYFTDFENAGFNSLLGEFSIFFVSLFSHGRYFYPKYNKKAYVVNRSILKKYNNYKIQSNFCIKGNCIYVNDLNLNLPYKNKKIILDLISVYINNENYKKYIKDFKYLKYYICMRFLTPINILLMDVNDQIIILILVVLFYEKINSLESLERFIGGINGNV